MINTTDERKEILFSLTLLSAKHFQGASKNQKHGNKFLGALGKETHVLCHLGVTALLTTAIESTLTKIFISVSKSFQGPVLNEAQQVAGSMSYIILFTYIPFPLAIPHSFMPSSPVYGCFLWVALFLEDIHSGIWFLLMSLA